MPIESLENTFADQLEGLYTPWTPKGFPAPALVLLNHALADELGLDPEALEAKGPALFSGGAVPEGARPLAQAYAGHQFGHFNPQLGDGRAVLLGEVVAPDGRRFDLQLKGSGTTPYSRGGDGRAALDSALREYVISEAMHALGVPTTRALAVVTTGETVVRDRAGPGAVLARVAASHLRVGTLEFFAARQKTDELRRLVDYTLRRHYPERADESNPALALLESVAASQASLVARWMLIGFVHGVMNTDNVALSGETIDFGPCAFMDHYDPKTVFSRIDRGGRYAYGNQPAIGAWNLARMAEALIDLLADEQDAAVELAHATLERYADTLDEVWLTGMRDKLGLPGVDPDDKALAQQWVGWLEGEAADYTSTFRALGASLRDGPPDDRFQSSESGQSWLERWHARLGGADRAAVADRMDGVNPIYIARNHQVEAALGAAMDGDLQPTRTLVEVLSHPFEAQPGREAYAEPAPDDFGPYQTHCNT